MLTSNIHAHNLFSESWVKTRVDSCIDTGIGLQEVDYTTTYTTMYRTQIDAGYR
jgi:hypothetical protein